MALPVAAAVPLSLLLVLEPFMPAQFGPLAAPPRTVFLLATIAGIPIATYAAFAGWWLVEGRWRRLAWLAAGTLLATVAVAVAWMCIDARNMPAIEHYGRKNWFRAAIPGAYAAGLLLPAAWAVFRVDRWLRRATRDPAT